MKASKDAKDARRYTEVNQKVLGKEQKMNLVKGYVYRI